MKKESDLQGSNSVLEQRTNIPAGYSNILYSFGALVGTALGGIGPSSSSQWCIKTWHFQGAFSKIILIAFNSKYNVQCTLWLTMSIYGSKRLPLTPLLLLMAPKVYFWLPMSTYGFICLLMAPYVYLWLLRTSTHSLWLPLHTYCFLLLLCLGKTENPVKIPV